MPKGKKPRNVPDLPIKTKITNNLQQDSLAPPNSEEDRIILTSTPKPAFSNYINSNYIKLNLDYIRGLVKEDLKFHFVHNTQYNQYTFCQAVEQNEKEIVKTILEVNTEFINIKTLSEEYNILHIALLGIADQEMVEILLHEKPDLIIEKDSKNLTPLMFGKKYGFGKAEKDESIEKIKEILEEYERNAILHGFCSSPDENFFAMKLIGSDSIIGELYKSRPLSKLVT
ncbi:MAG: hypothetical protein RCO49_07425 [Rickettsia endosymbiont of Argas persicus]